jgi:hypothetical protein
MTRKGHAWPNEEDLRAEKKLTIRQSAETDGEKNTLRHFGSRSDVAFVAAVEMSVVDPTKK